MKALVRLVVLTIRLAAGLLSVSEEADISISPAFITGRGLHRVPRVHSRGRFRLAYPLDRGVRAGGACPRECRVLRPVLLGTGCLSHPAAPASQLTRGCRIPTFDGTVIRMFFDDDRLSVTPFKTSKCDLRVNDASPRKPSKRLADKQNTRGVGRSGRSAER